MNDWHSTTLGKVLPFQYGKNLPKGARSHTGEFAVVSSAGFIDTHSEPLTKDPTVVIGRKGTVGSVFYCPDPVFPIDTTFYVEGSSKVSIRFAYYLLKSLPLTEMNTDAAVPGLNRANAERLEIQLPGPEYQQAIVEVLGSIDDLIENNRRRIEVLEKMARAIYSEWFVKFRYPGHEDVPMVDSALGLIPDGWEVQPLAAIATVNGSSRKPGGDEVFRYLDISALSERHIGELEAIGGSSAPGRARRVVSPGDTVWATVRPNRRAHALLVAPDSDWIASTGLAVLTPSTVSPDFLFETSSATAFSDWLVGRATGSAYPAVRAKDFEEAPIVVPDVAVDAAFADKVSPMHDLSWRLRNECSRLAALRDLLLPKLVTGQIDISTLDLDALVARQVA